MDIERERKQLELELEDNLEAVRTGMIAFPVWLQNRIIFAG